MLEKVVNSITEKMVREQIVGEEERELYQYGVRNGIMIVLNWLIVLLLGICTGHCLSMIAFTAAYSLLRSYAGGLHMSTHRRCFLFSLPIYVLSAGMISRLRFSFCPLFLLLVCAVVTLYVTAPVADSNKPLDAAEQKVYGMVIKVLATAFSVLSLVLYHLQCYHISTAILWAVVLTAVLCVAGKIKGRKSVR